MVAAARVLVEPDRLGSERECGDIALYATLARLGARRIGMLYATNGPITALLAYTSIIAAHRGIPARAAEAAHAAVMTRRCARSEWTSVRRQALLSVAGRDARRGQPDRMIGGALVGAGPAMVRSPDQESPTMAKTNTAAHPIAKTPMRTVAAEPSPKKSRKAALSERVRPLEAVIAETCAVPPIGAAAVADNASTAEAVDPPADNAADQGGIMQHVSALSEYSAKPVRLGGTRQQASSAVRPVDAALVPGPASSGKQARIIEMLRRPEGATNAQLRDATGWQAHSVRGVLSGVLKRKLGLPIDSTVEPGRGRVYRIDASRGSASDAMDGAAPPADIAARDNGSQGGIPDGAG